MVLAQLNFQFLPVLAAAGEVLEKAIQLLLLRSEIRRAVMQFLVRGGEVLPLFACMVLKRFDFALIALNQDMPFRLAFPVEFDVLAGRLDVGGLGGDLVGSFLKLTVEFSKPDAVL